MRVSRSQSPGIFRLWLLLVAATPSALAAGSGPAWVQAKGHLTAADRAAVIEATLARLAQRYVYPEVATTMARAVRAHQQAGRYDTLDGSALAEALTADLRTVSRDKHLQVVFRQADPGQRQRPRGKAVAAVEVMEGNVGYLRLDAFTPVANFAPDLDAAMKRLASTDALLVDLRENRGGAPVSAMYLAGYLLPKRTLVARIFSRPDNSTTEMWSEEVSAPKYLDRPVYILTSAATFSAAEAAAYHLTHLGRARTVGEATGGGAHRVQAEDLGHGFSIRVPFTRPISVVTNGDWEGVGVPPALPAPAADAVRVAHLDALTSLPPTESRFAAIERLKRERRR